MTPVHTMAGQPSNRNLIKLLLLGGLLLVAFWLRIHHLETIPPGLHYDEARYLLYAWRVAEGTGSNIPLDSSPEPFDFILRGVYMRLAGYTDFAARVYSIFLNLLAVAATIGAGRALYLRHPQRETVAWFAGLAFAVLPAATILSRYIYRMYHLPWASMLAVAALAWAWHTGRVRYYAIAGFLSGLAAIFYLSGLVFPVIMVGLIVLTALLNRHTWPHLHGLAAYAGGLAPPMLIWGYYYLRIPNWLGGRVDDVRYEFVSIEGTLRHAWHAIEPIYQADIPFLMAPRYNTFTTPYLNPALVGLLVLGVLWSVWRWQKPGAMVPLLVGLGLISPSVLTTNPAETVRLVGVFGPVALLCGLGAGVILNLGQHLPQRIYPALILALAVIALGSPIYTYQRVMYHFTEEPRLFAEAEFTTSIDAFHYAHLKETTQYIAQADTPLYLPNNHFNQQTMAAWLRPIAFPTVRPYSGQPLPEGMLFVPTDENRHRWPPIDQPTGFLLALPATGEIILLPPTVRATEIMEQVRESGEIITNADGWPLAHTLPYGPSTAAFTLSDSAPYQPTADAPPLAVFDDSLELLKVIAPDTLTPGEWIPITLYWRLRKPTNYDYFFRMQIWDTQQRSIGTQNDDFPAIHRWLYPTAMWRTGEIVSEMRWVRVFDDAPSGGYHIVLNPETHPFTRDVRINGGRLSDKGWLQVARVAVPFPPMPEPGPSAQPVDVTFSDAENNPTIQLNHIELAQPLTTLNGGESLQVQLYWEALAEPARPYTIFVHLLDEDGTLLAQQDIQPFDGRYPTDTWNAGITVMTTHTLNLPEGANPVQTLTIGLYDGLTLERLTASEAGQPLPDNIWRRP